VYTLLLTERCFLCWETKISYLGDPHLIELATETQIERRFVMCKKLLILSLCISVIIVFSTPIPSVNAGGKSKNINWRIVGTIVQFIDIAKPIQDPPYSEPIGPHSLIKLSAQGSPGPAEITLLSQSIGPPNSLQCISSNYFPVGYFNKNDFVALFPDQSFLFASIDPSVGGILCMGIPATEAEGTTYFKVKMNITGGIGRFDGASGGFEAEGYGYPGFSSDVTLVGENGRIKGRVEFSD